MSVHDLNTMSNVGTTFLLLVSVVGAVWKGGRWLSRFLDASQRLTTEMTRLSDATDANTRQLTATTETTNRNTSEIASMKTVMTDLGDEVRVVAKRVEKIENDLLNRPGGHHRHA